MKKILIITLLIVGCGTEPQDCAGVEGGTAQLDCFGVCGGVAIMDGCGLCTGGTTGLIANYLKDCAGVCGGNTTQEVCDACQTSVFDCAGVCEGSAVEDECGVCDAQPANDCVQDCNGSWGGAAVEDNCEVCDADSTNDCAMDCAGVWGGDATANECENSEDVYGCIDSNAVNYSSNATVSDSTCEYSVYGYPDFETICAMDEFGNPTTNIGEGICGLCLGQIEYDLNAGKFPPVQSELSSPYPNPFSSTTSINFGIASDSYTTIYIFNTDYTTIDTLVSRQLDAGYHSIIWDASTFPSGYYRIVADFGDVECFQNVYKLLDSWGTDTTYVQASINMEMSEDLNLTISIDNFVTTSLMSLIINFDNNSLSYQNYSVGDGTSLLFINTIDNAIHALFGSLPINSYTELINIQFAKISNYENTMIYLPDIEIIDPNGNFIYYSCSDITYTNPYPCIQNGGSWSINSDELFVENYLCYKLVNGQFIWTNSCFN